MGAFVVNIASALWLHNFSLEEKLETLSDGMNTLKSLKCQVEERIYAAEARLLEPRKAVLLWLERVQVMESEVSYILKEGRKLLGRGCLVGFCPCNFWASYVLGKQIFQNLALAKDLRNEHRLIGAVAVQVPVFAFTGEAITAGLESTLKTAWSCLQQGDVKTVGLFGMAGVGKTTILKKINNRCLKEGSGFDLVIWVSISKAPNLGRVQRDIGDRLGLDSRSTAEDISEVLGSKQFVLLLDDVWGRLDLSVMGIPPLTDGNRSKIVFSTRSEAVCGWMKADKKIRVELLSWDEAWKLFTSRVGQETLHLQPEIPNLAEKIVELCAGQPLALTVLGHVMASKRTAIDWENAVATIQNQNSAIDWTGMQDESFSILKFSYDNLPDQSIKSCFLYCALYPQGFSIPVASLVKLWIAEGFIDGFSKWEEAVDCGDGIIETLKASCLLETVDGNSYVRMHDTLRNLAIWISCDCGKDTNKVLVQTGSKPPTLNWGNAKSLSLVRTPITELVDVPICPKLSTLLLSESIHLKHISDPFFVSMPNLKVLDLSSTRLTRLPTTIGMLVHLEYLDLSLTPIEELPSETLNLKKLKHLFLDNTIRLPRISGGLIKRFPSLQMLRLSEKCFGSVREEKLAAIDDLLGLEKLMGLELHISSAIFLGSFLLKPRLVRLTKSLSIDINSERDGSTLRNAGFVLPASPPLSPASQSPGETTNLEKELCIWDCEGMGVLVINALPTEENGLFESLETMSIRNLPKLVVSWDTTDHPTARFRRLHQITIVKCNSTRDLTWLYLAPQLRTLLVESCRILEEIVSDDDGAFNANMFLKLEVLVLKDLPLLRFISATPLALPSLKALRVSQCPNLRRLPLDSNSVQNNSLKSIKGEAHWWNSLEWENEVVKQAAPFYPVE